MTAFTADKFYIDGRWVRPANRRSIPVINPATEEPVAEVVLGTDVDVDAAVRAARKAFDRFSGTSRQERLAMLKRITAEYIRRSGDLAQAMTLEMGAPATLSMDAQAGVGRAHLEQMMETLQSYEFEYDLRGARVDRVPIGVVGMITPWNWPMNQIVCKVAPAIATGCTMVLKPSEISPLSAQVFAEIMDASDIPAGVFNMVQGDGAGVGAAISSHPDIDMVSFTGSTRAGVLVAKAAADTVKRVAQELGGKSANILLPDAAFETAVAQGVRACFGNSGQSCNAPTRMLVPASRHEEVLSIARRAAEAVKVGDPNDPDTALGPVVNARQFDKIQDLIAAGIAEGATLVTGGVGRPEGLNRGYYVRPTVFGDVTADMRISREEIFGPVLSVLSYETVEDAVSMANDTEYGLAAYVQSANVEAAREVAGRMRAGTVYVNYPAWDAAVPFGGFKRSGNGREYADFAMDDFTEIRGIVG